MAGVASREAGNLLHNLLLFGRLLRRLGLDVHSGRMLDAIRVLDDIGVSRKADVRAALRTLLVHRREDLPVFDEAFDVFWRQRKDRMSSLDLRSMGEQRRYRRVEAGPPPPGQSDAGSNAEETDSDDGYDRIDLTQTFSVREVLRQKDFAEFTPGEMAQARLFLASLDWNPGVRRARRKERGRGPWLDLRRTLRESAQSGGELLHLKRRRRKEKPRRLVVVCDVSGSMERYTRMLLHFIHSLYGGLENHVEAFLFATRLTRVTKQLGRRDIDQAVADVAKAVPDWSGGTRIGAALKEFNFKWARRTLGWGSIVLIVSDGWDRGDPGALSDEMARSAAELPAPDLAQSLGGKRGIRAADPGNAGRHPVHRRSAAGAQFGGASGLGAPFECTRRRVGRPCPEAVSRTNAAELAEAVAAPAAPVQRSWHSDANPSFRHPMWGRGEQGRDP